MFDIALMINSKVKCDSAVEACFCWTILDTIAGVAPPFFRWLGQGVGVVGCGLSIFLFLHIVYAT